jgi:hypothetical protein
MTMERPKQQALLFLLGAVLVGGVLGFSADRVMRKPPRNWAERSSMYDDIGLSAAQRVSADSIWDATNCALSQVYSPVRPVLDSIRVAGGKHFRELLNPEQLNRFETRLRTDSLRRARADSTRRARGDSTHRGRQPNSRQDACKR